MGTETIPEPGELFQARDGNHNMLDDVRFPAEGEPTDFILDADGNELRVGDYALVLDSNWTSFKNKVVKVTNVSRGTIYDFPYPGRVERGAPKPWSPTCPLNDAHIVHRHHSTSARWNTLRKINMTEEDGMRLMLVDKLDEDAALATQIANLEAGRVVVRNEVRHLRAQIEAVE